MHVANNQP